MSITIQLSEISQTEHSHAANTQIKRQYYQQPDALLCPLNKDSWCFPCSNSIISFSWSFNRIILHACFCDWLHLRDTTFVKLYMLCVAVCSFPMCVITALLSILLWIGTLRISNLGLF